MRLIKIAIANLDPTVGAFRSNTDKIIEHARQMSDNHVTVGCFAEQAIAGYPSEDLVLWEGFVDAQWEALERFAVATGSFSFPTVFSVGLTVRAQTAFAKTSRVVRWSLNGFSNTNSPPARMAWNPKYWSHM